MSLKYKIFSKAAKAAVELFKIEQGQRWLVGTDAQEKPIKHIYMVKAEDNNPRGFKISYGNSSYHINMKGVVWDLGLTPPLRCKYEEFRNGEYKGIKLILPNPQ